MRWTHAGFPDRRAACADAPAPDLPACVAADQLQRSGERARKSGDTVRHPFRRSARCASMPRPPAPRVRDRSSRGLTRDTGRRLPTLRNAGRSHGENFLSRSWIVAACSFGLVGCSPTAEPATLSGASVGVAQTANAAECARSGGALKPVGRLQTMQCVIAFADAGKNCTSGSECLGDCRAAQDAPVSPDRIVAGTCQPTNNRFGCNTRVENGRAQSTVCID